MSKIGRNDRCPCGSDLKYKNCCMNNSKRSAGEKAVLEALNHLQGGRLLPINAVYHVNIANTLKNKCRLEEAVATFGKALQIQPA